MCSKNVVVFAASQTPFSGVGESARWRDRCVVARNKIFQLVKILLK